MFTRFWFIVLLLPVVVDAQFTFLTNNGAITITAYTGTNNNVVVPAATHGCPVTSIGISAFLNCYGVTNVILPTSVTNIDFQAFCNSGLTSIIIPDSVRTVGQSAFLDCNQMVYVSIGTNVASIGDDAFYDCGLTNLFIPPGVTNLLS